MRSMTANHLGRRDERLSPPHNVLLRIALSLGVTRLGLLLTTAALVVALELGTRRWVLVLGRVS
jgi:hypothetical protein